MDFGPPIGSVYVHTPEDLIIYQTWYFSLSRQTKQLRDIAAIAASLGAALDYPYIEAWIKRRGLAAIWQEILAAIRSGGLNSTSHIPWPSLVLKTPSQAVFQFKGR